SVDGPESTQVLVLDDLPGTRPGGDLHARTRPLLVQRLPDDVQLRVPALRLPLRAPELRIGREHALLNEIPRALREVARHRVEVESERVDAEGADGADDTYRSVEAP